MVVAGKISSSIIEMRVATSLLSNASSTIRLAILGLSQSYDPVGVTPLIYLPTTGIELRTYGEQLVPGWNLRSTFRLAILVLLQSYYPTGVTPLRSTFRLAISGLFPKLPPDRVHYPHLPAHYRNWTVDPGRMADPRLNSMSFRIRFRIAILGLFQSYHPPRVTSFICLPTTWIKPWPLWRAVDSRLNSRNSRSTLRFAILGLLQSYHLRGVIPPLFCLSTTGFIPWT